MIKLVTLLTDCIEQQGPSSMHHFLTLWSSDIMKYIESPQQETDIVVIVN